MNHLTHRLTHARTHRQTHIHKHSHAHIRSHKLAHTHTLSHTCARAYTHTHTHSNTQTIMYGCWQSWNPRNVLNGVHFSQWNALLDGGHLGLRWLERRRARGHPIVTLGFCKTLRMQVQST